MDDRVVKKLFIPSLLVTVLSAIFIYELKSLSDLLLFKKKHVLLIGILSAPENFNERLSIRKTWLQLLPEISASYYFIIGNEICEVPPQDRINPYSCIYLPFTLPQNVTIDTEFTTMKIQSLESKHSILDFIGFGVYIREPIIVRKIGILKTFMENVDNEIQVQLISMINNNVIASVTFSPEHLSNGTHSEVLTKSIKNIILEKSFEVFVKIKTNIPERKFYPNCSFTTWQFEPNILHFTHLWEEESPVPQPFTEESCSFVFLTYSIVDVKNITEQVKNRAIRRKEWKKSNAKLSVKLDSESHTYNDLLFVDVIDVYRNLSKKMIEFYKKIVTVKNFNYILKCDDDSFIDILRVYDQLQTVKKETKEVNTTELSAQFKLPKFWLWSYFKEYWKVERAGKWREDYYQSASYPTFPCGGGYVINKGIVDYIIANEPNLHNFQGEDVSLGIWLSPLPVIKYKAPKIIPSNGHNIQTLIQRKFGQDFKQQINELQSDLCKWTCDNKRKYNLPFCNKVQLDVKDMYRTWTEYITNGFL